MATKNERIKTQLLKLTRLSEAQKKKAKYYGTMHERMIYETEKFYYVTNTVSLVCIDKSAIEIDIDFETFKNTRITDEMGKIIDDALRECGYGSVRFNACFMPDVLRLFELLDLHPVISTISDFQGKGGGAILLYDEGVIAVLMGVN